MPGWTGTDSRHALVEKPFWLVTYLFKRHAFQSTQDMWGSGPKQREKACIHSAISSPLPVRGARSAPLREAWRAWTASPEWQVGLLWVKIRGHSVIRQRLYVWLKWWFDGGFCKSLDLGSNVQCCCSCRCSGIQAPAEAKREAALCVSPLRWGFLY